MCFLCLDVSGVHNILASPCAKRTWFCQHLFLGSEVSCMNSSIIRFNSSLLKRIHTIFLLQEKHKALSYKQLALSCLPLFLPLQCRSRTSVEAWLGTSNFKYIHITFQIIPTIPVLCFTLNNSSLSLSSSLKVITKNRQSLSQSLLLANFLHSLL